MSNTQFANANVLPVQITPGQTGVNLSTRPAARLKSYLGTTPGKLAKSLATIGVLLIMTATTGLMTYRGLHDAVQTIGKDTVPSIVAAQKIRATLADANAYAVNALLENERGIGKNRKQYREDMNAVNDSLLTAAQNITFGDEERQPILRMMSALAEYEHLIGITETQDSKSALVTLKQSQALMHDSILPASIALDKANFSHLDSGYKAHQQRGGTERMLFLFCSLGLIASLLVTQLNLMRMTKRMINIPLVVASLAGAGYLLVSLSILHIAEATLKRGKEDAFDSVHALWQAKAVAYDANADESLYLLYHGDTAAQKQSQEEFQSKAAQLVQGDLDTALKAANSNQKFAGYLGDELSNITFAGEKQAALQTLQTWAGYMEIDAKIRSHETKGEHADAITLNVGTNEGQSNWAFAQFDDALGKTLAINQREFDQAVEQCFAQISKLPIMTALTFLLIALATVFGLKPRFDEYRF